MLPLKSDHEDMRFHCVEALQKCYKELEDCSPMTSPQRLGENARRHLLLWTVLKQECQDPLLWCLYPKHHLFLHTAEGAATNPRLEWNYGDESEIGAAVKVAAGCNVAHLCTSTGHVFILLENH